MTAKITISTSSDKALLLDSLAKRLGVKKNQVFEAAISYYADLLENTTLQQRIKEVEENRVKLLTQGELERKLGWR